MANIILPTGAWADRQPQGWPGVAWHNPITRGLNIRVPLGAITRNVVDGFAPQTASSGHKIAASAAGLVSSFDGTQNGIVHTFTAPSFPITVSAWIFASGVGGGAVCALTGPSGGDNWWVHSLEVSPTTIFTNTAAGGGTDAGITYTLPAVGRWYHAALVVASATDRRLYIDGALVGTSTASRSFPNFAEARIGSVGGNWGGASKLVGLASDVNVWRRALALPEIQSIAGNPWQLSCDDDSDILIFDMGAGGGAVTASGSLAAVSLTAAAGTATGGASASSAIAAVSLGAAQASATGGASASAPLDAIDLTPANGAATAGATATGAMDAVDLTPVSGTASGGAVVPGNASGSLAPVSLAAAAGSASAAANAAAVFASLAINPATGAAYGAAVAVGSLPVITLSPATATATGGASIAGNASGAFAGISLSAITGTANDLEASASPYVALVPYTNHIAFVPSSTTTAVRGL